LIDEKVKAIEHTNGIFPNESQHFENSTIPQTKRTAATNRHPRKVIVEDSNLPNK
jgi:hypothetical protein